MKYIQAFKTLLNRNITAWFIYLAKESHFSTLSVQHSLPVIAASLSDTRKSWEFLHYQLPGKSSAAMLWCLLEVLGVFSLLRLRSSLAEPCPAHQQPQQERLQHSQCSAPVGSMFLQESPARGSWNQSMYWDGSLCLAVLLALGTERNTIWLWVLKTHGTGSKMSYRNILSGKLGEIKVDKMPLCKLLKNV